MFVGHYGPAFAGKAAVKTVPLWVLFLAVQLVDIGWATLVILGVEKVRIVHGFMALSDLDLYYMPFTHGLISSLIWAMAAGALYVIAARNANRLASFAVLAIAVFSHWLLDLLVHTRDMPLWDDSAKVGLGLWNYPAIELPLEAAILIAGFYFYLRATVAKTPAGKYSPWIVLALLILIHVSVVFQPAPSSPILFGVMALASYAVFAALAYWLDRTRAPAQMPKGRSAGTLRA